MTHLCSSSNCASIRRVAEVDRLVSSLLARLWDNWAAASILSYRVGRNTVKQGHPPFILVDKGEDHHLINLALIRTCRHVPSALEDSGLVSKT